MQEHLVCIRCGRKLKSAESKELGFGPVCYKKWQTETLTRSLFSNKIKEGGVGDATQQQRYDTPTPDSPKQ